MNLLAIKKKKMSGLVSLLKKIREVGLKFLLMEAPEKNTLKM